MQNRTRPPPIKQNQNTEKIIIQLKNTIKHSMVLPLMFTFTAQSRWEHPTYLYFFFGEGFTKHDSKLYEESHMDPLYNWEHDLFSNSSLSLFCGNLNLILLFDSTKELTVLLLFIPPLYLTFAIISLLDSGMNVNVSR